MQGTLGVVASVKENVRKGNSLVVVATVSRRSGSPRLFTQVQEPHPDQPHGPSQPLRTDPLAQDGAQVGLAALAAPSQAPYDR